MPFPPKVKSAVIRYDDDTWVVIRPGEKPGEYRYRYWGDPDEDGDVDLIAYNDHNSGIWAALMAVAVMAQIPAKE
jgi:hypothetical protein